MKGRRWMPAEDEILGGTQAITRARAERGDPT